jgi:flavin-dependent dehydrogenase
MNPISIIGGGLAGLSLGIALRRHDIAVTLYEAGTYPRHKVCGEFIAGIKPDTLNKLGISGCLEDACHHRKTAWFLHNRQVREDVLPEPVIGISRFALDDRLANEFVRLGGKLHTHHRVRDASGAEGQVWAAGRQLTKSSWIGIKLHSLDYSLESDLEVHLGKYGYAGASSVENGQINICGLFRRRPDIREKKQALLLAYLEACGMNKMASKLRNSRIDLKSSTGVAAIDFNHSHQAHDKIYLGDQFTVIPPFTGNGMTMAFEAGVLAAEPIAAYASEKQSWSETVNSVNWLLRQKFRLRLILSRLMHPWLYTPSLQHILFGLSRTHLLPFQTLFKVLH